jgi:hypothetical protein
MKKILLLLLTIAFSFPVVNLGQLAQFNFPATNSLVVSTKNANVSVTDISLSSGTIETNKVTGTYFPNSPYIEGNAGWAQTTQADAKYFTFTITANPGYTFDITNISFNAYATAAGPSAFSAEVDGTNITVVNAPSTTLVNYSQAVNKTGLTSAVIKIQGWLNGSRSSSGTGIFKLDDVIISGSVSTVPEINVKQNSTNYLTGSTFEMGNVAVGSSSNSVSFTIENLGNTNLLLTGLPKISISGTNTSEFAVDESVTSGTVGASGSTTFNLTFTPASKGTKNAAITISNNDSDEGSYTINLTGTGNLGNTVVIAEIYGGGGNSNAAYTNDYIVLYNPTYSSIDLSGYSIQYAAATSSTYSVTNLSGTIPAGSYYLIKEGNAGEIGASLPVTPNATGSFNIAAASGKIALVNYQTAITGKSNAHVIDFVGYGSNATEYETAPMSGSGLSSYKASLRRKDNSGNNTYGTNGSGWDSDDNSNDFYCETNIASNSPLPVELTLFTGSVLENGVHLNWSTATEVNNYGFEVERSISIYPLPGSATEDRRGVWDKAGFVAGHGNSNSPKNYSFTDVNVPAGNVSYRLKQIDLDGRFEYSDVVNLKVAAPVLFFVKQNFPNPFNPATTIKYELPANSYVTVKVFDLIGREIETLVNRNETAGVHSVNFDGKNLSSGMYIYKVQAGSYYQIKKMLLLK